MKALTLLKCSFFLVDSGASNGSIFGIWILGENDVVMFVVRSPDSTRSLIIKSLLDEIAILRMESASVGEISDAIER